MATFSSIQYLASSKKIKVNWITGSPTEYNLSGGVKLVVTDKNNLTVTTGIITSGFKEKNQLWLTTRNSGTDGELVFGDISYDCNSQSNVIVGSTRIQFPLGGYVVAIIGTDELRGGRRPAYVYQLDEQIVYLQTTVDGSNNYDLIIGNLVS